MWFAVGAVYGCGAVVSGVSDPGDFLQEVVSGDVFDFAGGEHVHVDTFDAADGFVCAADFEEHTCFSAGVLLVWGVVGDFFEFGAEESCWPVAFFAGITGGSERLDRGVDGSVVGVEPDGEDLSGSGEF